MSVRLHIEAVGGIAEKALDGTCGLGVIATVPELPPRLTGRPLSPATMAPIASPTHPSRPRERISFRSAC